MGWAENDFLDRNQRWKRQREIKLENKVQQRMDEEMKEVNRVKEIKVKKDYSRDVNRKKENEHCKSFIKANTHSNPKSPSGRPHPV